LLDPPHGRLKRISAASWRLILSSEIDGEVHGRRGYRKATMGAVSRIRMGLQGDRLGKARRVDGEEQEDLGKAASPLGSRHGVLRTASTRLLQPKWLLVVDKSIR